MRTLNIFGIFIPAHSKKLVYMAFKRKIYSKLLDWKNTTQGKKALLIEGARRIGKSTIAEEFARHEYKSYILIDFNDVSDAVINAFNNLLGDLDTFFMVLSTEFGVELFNRDSLIIFDEVQRFPKARQSIKKLVKDGRYDYLETGSLISIQQNVKDITIPSEERAMDMHPMDFEEFCDALGESMLVKYIKNCFAKRIPLERGLHEKAMLIFKEYILVGGMPQSVVAFLEKRSFQRSDEEKRDILKLYRDDIMKIEDRYQSRVLSIFDQIPAFLSQHEKRIVFNEIQAGSYFAQYADTFFWLGNSRIVNECFNCTDPNIGLTLNEERAYIKCYMGDTGLLASHAFSENAITENELYKQILNGKLNLNEGMLYENAIAQMLWANGHKAFFYTHYNEEKHRNDIEIDFIITDNNKVNFKIFPIEVKSGKRYKYESLTRFCEKFRKRIGEAYIIHPKNFEIKDDGIICLPAYMAMCL